MNYIMHKTKSVDMDLERILRNRGNPNLREADATSETWLVRQPASVFHFYSG